jgi:hypothetical protein
MNAHPYRTALATVAITNERGTFYVCTACLDHPRIARSARVLTPDEQTIFRCECEHDSHFVAISEQSDAVSASFGYDKVDR